MLETSLARFIRCNRQFPRMSGGTWRYCNECENAATYVMVSQPSSCAARRSATKRLIPPTCRITRAAVPLLAILEMYGHFWNLEAQLAFEPSRYFEHGPAAPQLFVFDYLMTYPEAIPSGASSRRNRIISSALGRFLRPSKFSRSRIESSRSFHCFSPS